MDQSGINQLLVDKINKPGMEQDNHYQSNIMNKIRKPQKKV